MNDRELCLPSSWLLLPLGLLLTLVGALASPRDAQGRPLLLLPDVKAMEDHRRAVSSNATSLHLLDGEISALLEGQSLDLFTQSRQAQAAFEHGLHLAQAVDVQAAPPALDGLRQASAQAASAYLETARLALRWVGLSEEANKSAAEDQSAQAHQGAKPCGQANGLLRNYRSKALPAPGRAGRSGIVKPLPKLKSARGKPGDDLQQSSWQELKKFRSINLYRISSLAKESGPMIPFS
jgi:hypothetical protein